tara:strand:- start:423 stop:674 length:252 start_codon:yes stop_codon:yes gene_type:complete
MTDRAKKITELTSIGTANTSIVSGDLFIVEDVSANTTKSATLSTLRKAIVQGPYADDTAANTAGVALGQLYYTVAGAVKVRIV